MMHIWAPSALRLLPAQPPSRQPTTAPVRHGDTDMRNGSHLLACREPSVTRSKQASPSVRTPFCQWSVFWFLVLLSVVGIEYQDGNVLLNSG